MVGHREQNKKQLKIQEIVEEPKVVKTEKTKKKSYLKKLFKK